MLYNLKYNISLDTPNNINIIYTHTSSQTHTTHHYAHNFTSRLTLYFKINKISPPPTSNYMPDRVLTDNQFFDHRYLQRHGFKTPWAYTRSTKEFFFQLFLYPHPKSISFSSFDFLDIDISISIPFIRLNLLSKNYFFTFSQPISFFHFPLLLYMFTSNLILLFTVVTFISCCQR